MPDTIENIFEKITFNASNEQIVIANLMDDLFGKTHLEHLFVVCGGEDFWLIVDTEEGSLDDLISVSSENELVYNNADAIYIGPQVFDFIQDALSFYDDALSESEQYFNHNLRTVFDYFEKVFGARNRVVTTEMS